MSLHNYSDRKPTKMMLIDKKPTKKLFTHHFLQYLPIKSNTKLHYIAHGATSAFNLLLYAHQSPRTLTRVFSRQLHFSQNHTHISERKRSRIEEVFHTSWQNHAHIRAFTQTFGSFSHIGVYSVDGRLLRNHHLRFQYPAFSYFLSFSFVLPFCGFQASLSYDDTWMLNSC